MDHDCFLVHLSLINNEHEANFKCHFGKEISFVITERADNHQKPTTINKIKRIQGNKTIFSHSPLPSLPPLDTIKMYIILMKLMEKCPIHPLPISFNNIVIVLYSEKEKKVTKLTTAERTPPTTVITRFKIVSYTFISKAIATLIVLRDDGWVSVCVLCWAGALARPLIVPSNVNKNTYRAVCVSQFPIIHIVFVE